MEKDLRFGSCDQGQRVDRAADVGPEDRVHAAMLLDPAQPGELRGDNGGAEMIAAAVEVDDIGPGARNGRLDALFVSLARIAGLAILPEALDLPTETQE
jgi:hypothetical protein